MLGWIALGLFVAGITIFFCTTDDWGASGEERMSNAILGGFGLVLMGVSMLIVLGVGIWNLF